LRLNALACVALPTCGLAMAEAERYLPDFVNEVDAAAGPHGLADAPIHLRISGCPNGCSRPYLGEIALVGKAPGRYNLMLGADHRGERSTRCIAKTSTRRNPRRAGSAVRGYAASATQANASATSCCAAASSPAPPAPHRHIHIEVAA
jgi:sulfite reductase beta subunit-like hemoprotein